TAIRSRAPRARAPIRRSRCRSRSENERRQPAFPTYFSARCPARRAVDAIPGGCQRIACIRRPCGGGDPTERGRVREVDGQRGRGGGAISVRSLSPFGERVGVRGLQNYRETLTPHPTPLPPGEGADRVCRRRSARCVPTTCCRR